MRTIRIFGILATMLAASCVVTAVSACPAGYVTCGRLLPGPMSAVDERLSPMRGGSHANDDHACASRDRDDDGSSGGGVLLDDEPQRGSPWRHVTRIRIRTDPPTVQSDERRIALLCRFQ